MALAMRSSAATRVAGASRLAPARPRTLTTRRVMGVHELMQLAAPGDVEAPISTAVAIGVVVTVAVTALLPLALKPGDDAAQKARGHQCSLNLLAPHPVCPCPMRPAAQIFAAKDRAPLDKKKKTSKR
ncbi:hypothetical protein MNEG_2687 [Monoraphidium neglectum]|uniref:Uncharacterized protein n=1 Tax=Monoraphidium neglectum TaxID=145388 RepID=A0A0D2NKE3_9CHLO|nr:hypothetical protein MNEG_2687 [Monoraphidium neglectum]KIZ05266.1 hypothetical protein MNEG_2687 [Monoraphidium neglectum]|eukprot:XP_013904285.1 hypothetical protein MNEG_2687 [Monoraphidium neglectum]